MFQTHQECLVHLEKIRWDGIPICPYCGSNKSSRYKSEHRYHCSSCFTSYSVTVDTLFHKTHVDLHKWFQAILILYKLNPDISGRKLAQAIQVNRATASLMIKRVLGASPEQAEILKAIVRSTEK